MHWFFRMIIAKAVLRRLLQNVMKFIGIFFSKWNLNGVECKLMWSFDAFIMKSRREGCIYKLFISGVKDSFVFELVWNFQFILFRLCFINKTIKIAVCLIISMPKRITTQIHSGKKTINFWNWINVFIFEMKLKSGVKDLWVTAVQIKWVKFD